MKKPLTTAGAAQSGPRAGANGPPRRGTPATTVKLRILIVDDHPMTREGLAVVINRQSDLEVAGAASNAAEALALFSKVKPDLLVTDITMPGRSGLELLKDIHAIRPELPMLVLSMHDELLYAERALRAGARGYVMKDAGPDKLLEVIRLVVGGHSYVSKQVSARLVDAVGGHRPRGSSSPIEKLSDREFEVFKLLGSGLSTKEVAHTLHVSPKTVDVHRANIRTSLKLKTGPGLVHTAVRWMETLGASL